MKKSTHFFRPEDFLEGFSRDTSIHLAVCLRSAGDFLLLASSWYGDQMSHFMWGCIALLSLVLHLKYWDNALHSDWLQKSNHCRTGIFLKADFYPRLWRKQDYHHRDVFNFNANHSAHTWVNAGQPLTVIATCMSTCVSPQSHKLHVCRFRWKMMDTTTKKKKSHSNRD